MKLLGSLLCVVAVSMGGCVDEVSTGGGQGDGITPDKVSFVDPDVLRGMSKISDSVSADHICAGCYVTKFEVENSGTIEEVELVTAFEIPDYLTLNGGEFIEILCAIYKNGDEIVSDCNFP